MRRLLLTVLLASTNPLPILAQPLSPLSPNANSRMPQCGPELDGQAMCRFGVIYECQFVDPNQTESRPGWRWKSDILRGCDPGAAPADLPGSAGSSGGQSLPPGFVYAPQFGTAGSQSGSNPSAALATAPSTPQPFPTPTAVLPPSGAANQGLTNGQTGPAASTARPNRRY